MLKKHMAACLVATAFMAVPAMAQEQRGVIDQAGEHRGKIPSGVLGT